MKKISLVLAALMLFLFCGCSSTMVRTVVLPEEPDEGRIEPGELYAFEELVPQNMVLNKFAGFDNDNRVVGWFTKGNNCCIMLFDVEARIGQQVVNTNENVVSVKVAGEGKILYETVKNGVRSLYLVDKDGKTDKVAEYTAESSCVGADIDEDKRIFAAYRKDGKLKLLVADTATGAQKTYDITSDIHVVAKDNLLSIIKIKDISVGKNGRIAVIVSANDHYYMWTGIMQKNGTFKNSFVAECEGTEHVYVSTSVFYVAADGSLMRFNAEKNEQSVIMSDVEEFVVSADESVVACIRNQGTAKRVYVKETDPGPVTLVDIRQGIKSVVLNDDGTLLMLECYGKADASGKYSVMELER